MWLVAGGHVLNFLQLRLLQERNCINYSWSFRVIDGINDPFFALSAIRGK